LVFCLLKGVARLSVFSLSVINLEEEGIFDISFKSESGDILAQHYMMCIYIYIYIVMLCYVTFVSFPIMFIFN
jgi:hypothetical protein